MLFMLIAFGLVDLVALVALAFALYRAPEGYQSHDGFHFGPGCDTDDIHWPSSHDHEPELAHMAAQMMAGPTG